MVKYPGAEFGIFPVIMACLRGMASRASRGWGGSGPMLAGRGRDPAASAHHGRNHPSVARLDPSAAASYKNERDLGGLVACEHGDVSGHSELVGPRMSGSTLILSATHGATVTSSTPDVLSKPGSTPGWLLRWFRMPSDAYFQKLARRRGGCHLRG